MSVIGATFVVVWSLATALRRLDRRGSGWALFAFVAATVPIHAALWYGPVAHLVG